MTLLSAGKFAVNDTLSSEAWCRPHAAHPEGGGAWRLRCPTPEVFPGHCTVLLWTPVTPQAPQSLRKALVIVLLSESLWADDTRSSFSCLRVQVALSPGFCFFHHRDYINL